MKQVSPSPSSPSRARRSGQDRRAVCVSPGVTIYQGKAEDVLPQLAGTFDACLCDPPYGLAFMGKAWDHGVPGPDMWAEVLRVLKPGAPLMAFGGTRTFHRLACAIEDGGFALSDTLCWLHGQGFPKGHAQLKPAWEPITLAWKKGKRVLAIDAGRIEGRPPSVPQPRFNTTGTIYGMKTGEGRNGELSQATGRWPANVILDEESAAALDLQSGVLTSGNNPAKRSADKHRTVYAGWKGEQCLVHRGTDSGGASRFFYCAKASRGERGDGNTHPTVKPLKLLEYLARLILPPKNGKPRRLLVPFSGSGSEMIAARRAGWDEVVGIELNPDYCSMAVARLVLQEDPARARAA